MNRPDNPERLERLKQVLADSYPERPDERTREPLPESVRDALRGGTAARAEAAKAPLMERLLSVFRGPQLMALGAAAVVVLVAVIALNPPGPPDAPGDGGKTMRSTGNGAGLPSVVVLHGLDDARAAALEESGYFREDQLLKPGPDTDLDAFLKTHRRPNLVLVDGTAGEISTPFAADPDKVVVSFDVGDDLADAILEILANLPEPEEIPESE
jgi:hypothetical protein